MEMVRISLRYTATQHSTLAAGADLRESSVALHALEVGMRNDDKIA